MNPGSEGQSRESKSGETRGGYAPKREPGLAAEFGEGCGQMQEDQTVQEESDRKDQIRISISVTPQLRESIRIAAAYADMDVGEWAATTLKEAADKAIGADRGLPPQ